MSRLDPDRVHVPQAAPSWADRAVALLDSYRVGIYLCILAVTALLVSGRWAVPTLPEWSLPYLKGFAVGIIPATVLGKVAIVDKFLPDRRLKVLVFDVPDALKDVDLSKVQNHDDLQKTMRDANAGKLDVYGKRVPRGLWRERERGDWPEWKPPGNVDAIVTDYEYDEESHTLRVEGVNPELANPASIAARDGMLAELYGIMLDAVQELTRVEATLEAKTVEIERNNVNALMEAVEHGVAFETGGLDVIRGDRWGERDADADDRETGRSDTPDRDERPTLSDVLEAAQGGQQAVADGGERQ